MGLNGYIPDYNYMEIGGRSEKFVIIRERENHKLCNRGIRYGNLSEQSSKIKKKKIAGNA